MGAIRAWIPMVPGRAPPSPPRRAIRNSVLLAFARFGGHDQRVVPEMSENLVPRQSAPRHPLPGGI